jgi:hypothetical protein
MHSVQHQRRKVLTALFALLAVAALFQPIQAQILYGTLVGTVEDPSHASVPGASVKLTSPATGLTRETNTDMDGRFQFTNVLPGAYTLSVSQTGFRSYVKTGVGITINTVVIVYRLRGPCQAQSASASEKQGGWASRSRCLTSRPSG